MFFLLQSFLYVFSVRLFVKKKQQERQFKGESWSRGKIFSEIFRKFISVKKQLF